MAAGYMHAANHDVEGLQVVEDDRRLKSGDGDEGGKAKGLSV